MSDEPLFTEYELLTIFNDHSYACTDVINFYSLNICGLRSKLNCEDFIDECVKHDVCLFQETKTDEADDPDINDFFRKARF